MSIATEIVFADTKRLTFGKGTLVMGILNVTDDSFSDGGQFNSKERAIEHMQAMVEAGAAIIDVGAESTRPGAKPVSADEETERLLPILKELVPLCPVPLSVDSYHASTIQAALQCGANIVNSVGGLICHGETLSAAAAIAAKFNAPLIATHGGDISSTASTDIVADIEDFSNCAVKIAQAAGLSTAKNLLWLDPGIGFTDKSTAQNLRIVKHLPRLVKTKLPLVVGASRKRFIGEVLNLPVNEREEGSHAIAAAATLAGAAIVRAHDVTGTVRVCRMLNAVNAA